jgi:type IV pilus assembly protein PilC
MKSKKQKSGWNINIDISGVNDIEVLMFTKHLAVTLKSGLTLMDGLELLQSQAKGRMKKVLAKILSRVQSGDSFESGLNQFPEYFSATYTNMVRSGEASGTLEEKLEKLTIQLTKSHALKKKIKAAMIYPMLVFVAVFGLGMSVSIFVLPKILPLFKTLDVELPVTTRGLIYLAELFETNGHIIFLSSIAVIIFLAWFFKRDFVKPYSHRVFLKIPVVGEIIKNINLEKFTHTFGTLLESGLTVDKSLHITAEAIDNRVFKSAINDIIPQVKAGNTIVSAISKYPNIFPPITAKMIGVGEKTGNLDNTLQYLSDFYEEMVDDATKNLSTVIEPVLLITIGVVVGTVAIAILGPIYEITANLK